MSVLSATRTTAADLVQQRAVHTRHWACAAFVLSALIASAITWQGWPTLLTGSASVAVSFGVFYLRGPQLRSVMLVSALLWSYNAWLFHSPEQITGNSLGIAAAMYGLWRTRNPNAQHGATNQGDRTDAATADFAQHAPTITKRI